MLRRQLRPTLAEAARAARMSGNDSPAPNSGSGISVPAGHDVVIRAETSTDETEVRSDGRESTETHRVSTPDKGTKLSDVATRIERVESVVKNLQGGVSTQGRWNTVSTSEPPSTANDYPEGAWWTKVASADDMTPQALWTVENGKWVTKPLPVGQTVAPYLNTGLISAGAVAAAIIKSDDFWTALSGERVGFNNNGFQAYDKDGRQTVKVNGNDNYISGRGELGGWAFKTENNTSVIARADYGDITVGASGQPDQSVPHIETSASNGTIITHKSIGSTPYMALRDNTAALASHGRGDMYSQAAAGIDGQSVYSGSLAMRDSTARCHVGSSATSDKLSSLISAQQLSGSTTTQVYCETSIDSTRAAASLIAGRSSDWQANGIMVEAGGEVFCWGPLSKGGTGSTIRFMRFTVIHNTNPGSGKGFQFNIGKPTQPGCAYWPVSVLPIESGGTADWVCKISNFNPDNGTGKLWCQKVSGSASNGVGIDFIVMFVQIRSNGWRWE